MIVPIRNTRTALMNVVAIGLSFFKQRPITIPVAPISKVIGMDNTDPIRSVNSEAMNKYPRLHESFCLIANNMKGAGKKKSVMVPNIGTWMVMNSNMQYSARRAPPSAIRLPLFIYFFHPLHYGLKFIFILYPLRPRYFKHDILFSKYE